MLLFLAVFNKNRTNFYCSDVVVKRRRNHSHARQEMDSLCSLHSVIRTRVVKWGLLTKWARHINRMVETRNVHRIFLFLVVGGEIWLWYRYRKHGSKLSNFFFLVSTASAVWILLFVVNTFYLCETILYFGLRVNNSTVGAVDITISSFLNASS
jgi:hypothetical protein